MPPVEQSSNIINQRINQLIQYNGESEAPQWSSSSGFTRYYYSPKTCIWRIGNSWLLHIVLMYSNVIINSFSYYNITLPMSWRLIQGLLRFLPEDGWIIEGKSYFGIITLNTSAQVQLMSIKKNLLILTIASNYIFVAFYILQ